MKKFIKHSFIFIFLLSVLFSPISVYANDTILSSQKEYLENGDYFEITTIEHDTNSFFATSKTITASRTAKYASKNSSRSGNTASATATANLYKGSKIIKTTSKTVKLSCSKNGTLS